MGSIYDTKKEKLIRGLKWAGRHTASGMKLLGKYGAKGARRYLNDRTTYGGGLFGGRAKAVRKKKRKRRGKKITIYYE